MYHIPNSNRYLLISKGPSRCPIGRISLSIFLGFILLLPLGTKACNFSSLTLDSLIPAGGGTYMAYTTLCVGGGVLGVDRGADALTSTFAFAPFGGGAVILGYSPDTMTSSITGCTFGSFLIPNTSVTSPYISGTGDSATSYVVYQSTLSCGILACVSSNPDCGPPDSVCYPFQFLLSALPDSLVALGIEGAGSASNGCHRFNLPLSTVNQMTIYFPTITPVTWGAVSASHKGQAVEVQWETLSETTSDYFKVQRSVDAVHWASLGAVPASGNSLELRAYRYLDPWPPQGEVFYRIREVDQNGRHADSPVMRVYGDAKESILGGSFVGEALKVRYFSPQEALATCRLYNLDGKILLEHQFQADGSVQELQFQIGALPPGVYCLTVRDKGGSGQSILLHKG